MEWDIAKSIDGFIKPQDAKVIENSTSRIAAQQSEDAPEPADDHPLQNKDALNLIAPGAHGHEDGNVAILFHHQHDEHN